jgi:hypothetical protein
MKLSPETKLNVVLFIGILILLAAIVFGDRTPREQQVVGIGDNCPTMVCSVTSETGTYCRISSTGYRAYPFMENNTGYKDCINKAIGTKGTWSTVAERTISFTESHCLFMDNATMCFKSTDAIEDAELVAAIQGE